jgi:hypothetical protein
MAEYERLEIVQHIGGCQIDLSSPLLSDMELVIKDGETVLKLTHLDFFKILLSMLQEVSGDHIAIHLPSHGIGKREKDLDMVEAFAEKRGLPNGDKTKADTV